MSWQKLFENPLGVGRRVGSFGDVNPIDYGGGVVFRTNYGLIIEYTPGFDQYPPPKKVEVYRVDLPNDVFAEYDWAKPGPIARTAGADPGALVQLGRSQKFLDRVAALESIAGYHGWHELDTDPLVLTEKELRARWRL